MDEHHSWYNGSVWHIDWPYQVYIGQWPIFYGPAILKTLMEKCCTWDNGSVWLKDQPCKIYVGQWSIFHGPFAIYHCHRLKLFLYIKKWHRPGVLVSLRALALLFLNFLTDRSRQTTVWSVFAIPSASFGCITLRKRHLVQILGWLQ